MSDTYRQAPAFIKRGKDYQEHGRFYSITQEAADKVMQTLSGKNGNELKIMMVLLGTLGDGSFRISERWILDRTGMEHSSYIRAR